MLHQDGGLERAAQRLVGARGEDEREVVLDLVLQRGEFHRGRQGLDRLGVLPADHVGPGQFVAHHRQVGPLIQVRLHECHGLIDAGEIHHRVEVLRGQPRVVRLHVEGPHEVPDRSVELAAVPMDGGEHAQCDELVRVALQDLLVEGDGVVDVPRG